MKLNPEDLKIDIFAGPNDITGVRVTHLRTGIIASSDIKKTYWENRDAALEMLEKLTWPNE